MVEYDHTSVPGIMYISMTEEKINSITDDVKNDIADLDKMAKYEIILPEGSQNFEVGEEVVPIYTVMKNGAPKPVDIDIIPLNSGKGNAVAAVLRHYGFSKDEAIAFGDGHNDIEMLEAVGMGVAMGNAKDEVKAKADFVCKSVEDDGIYHYCIENKLIF